MVISVEVRFITLSLFFKTFVAASKINSPNMIVY